VNGKTTGADADRIASTDQTLAGKSNMRTAKRNAIATQSAA
jgi:hypothetical protein